MANYNSNTTYRQLTAPQIEAVEAEIKRILHAHRDCLRNQDKDTSKITFDGRDVYYGEAFGIMRALVALGFGAFGPSNIPHPHYSRWNLRWWFSELTKEVLEEENYEGNQKCDHCLKTYGKDGAGRTR